MINSIGVSFNKQAQNILKKRNLKILEQVMGSYLRMIKANNFDWGKVIFDSGGIERDKYVFRYTQRIIDETIDEFMDEKEFFRNNIREKSMELHEDERLLDHLLNAVLNYKPHFTEIIKSHGEEYVRYTANREIVK